METTPSIAPDPDFPHSLSVLRVSPPPPSSANIASTISLPLPSHHLANTLQRALSVDKEISPFVQRTYTAHPSSTILQIYYKATTARMLRVATNGMFESLGTVLRVCEELDVDVLEKELGG